MAKLYIVPTPIGNLKDITLRALEILKQSDLILAENTRNSSRLLKHYEIHTPMQSFHKFNEHKTLAKYIRQLQEGKTIALISDSGMPGISDPGYLIIRECIEKEIETEILPGPSAILPALVNSGLPCDRFCFEGFLPHKKGRNKKMKELIHESRTMVFYESPFRLLKTLELFLEHFGPERKASVSRELTKIYEETIRGKLPDLIEHFTQSNVKGEIVIVLEGNRKV